MKQMLYTLYFIMTTLTTIGYGDFLAQTYEEKIGMMLVMLLGAIIFGINLGSISDALSF